MGERIEQEYYRNGTLKRRSYYNDKDKLHRLDGPAEEVFLGDGTIAKREWRINGQKHRADGPAV